ncbi:MAG: DCC1-like thiol-disulfide oxidoreductase family protein [Gemmatimonadota bacterium]|nr:DCC1-like thiol-disulfide oxidoreductase family protein [Gemmatimonadota bacterium]MDE2979747.1 DCC1-like thiol-disulfide oxidoreductase family protein [Gemmatimonadota bacterium]
MNVSRPVILFDGVCNLCNASVRWVLRRDTRARFDFASLQSAASKRILEAAGVEGGAESLPDAIVLVDREGVHTGAAAALRIARRLSFPHSLPGVLGAAVPAAIRDPVYRFVARNRYRWFGRRDRCALPAPEHAARFLDADEAR